MNFTRDYIILVKYAKQQAYKYNLINDMSGEDIVSEIYANLFSDSKYSYEIESFKKAIWSYCIGYNQVNTKIVSYKEKHTKVHDFKGDCTCAKCKQVLPVSLFPIKTSKGGAKYLSNWCRDCIAIYKSERLKKIRSTEEGRNNLIKYYSKYRDSESVKQKKRIDNLDDSYIIKVLVRHRKYSRQDIESNPDLIIKKRRQLLIKRQIKKEQLPIHKAIAET